LRLVGRRLLLVLLLHVLLGILLLLLLGVLRLGVLLNMQLLRMFLSTLGLLRELRLLGRSGGGGLVLLSMRVLLLHHHLLLARRHDLLRLSVGVVEVDRRGVVITDISSSSPGRIILNDLNLLAVDDVVAYLAGGIFEHA